MTNKNIIRFALGIVLVAAAWYFYQSRQPRFGAGEKAPDIQFNLSNGQTLALSSLKGKTVLLHFWGSWCGPCRAENPHIAEYYQQYHEKGLEIISISIERNPGGWEKAIQKDGLVWPMHLMESGRFDGPVSTAFNVRQIPTLFLINKEGYIIGVNPGMPLLGKMLSENI